jgi:hypothetical protein
VVHVISYMIINILLARNAQTSGTGNPPGVPAVMLNRHPQQSPILADPGYNH